jgi:catechol 2,3-dioxygenase-like lactoylglutathione lyase family enzyme
VKKSRFLYETVLGQEVAADFGENVAFKGGFAIHQKEHFRGLVGGRPVLSPSHNFELYFEEDDLEKIEAELKAGGFSFVHEIREQPWRQRVLRFYDYDGNIVEIGERLEYVAHRLHQEGLPVEEIARIIYLPAAKVREAIEEYER